MQTLIKSGLAVSASVIVGIGAYWYLSLDPAPVFKGEVVRIEGYDTIEEGIAALGSDLPFNLFIINQGVVAQDVPLPEYGEVGMIAVNPANNLAWDHVHGKWCPISQYKCDVMLASTKVGREDNSN